MCLIKHLERNFVVQQHRGVSPYVSKVTESMLFCNVGVALAHVWPVSKDRVFIRELDLGWYDIADVVQRNDISRLQRSRPT
jgi:hypothetical protein